MMRKVLSLLAAGVLSAGLAMAQTTAPSAPPAQDSNNSASSADNNASAARSKDKAAAKPSDTTVGADQNAAATTDNNAKPTDPNAAPGDAQQPQRAESADPANRNRADNRRTGGVPWLWIALGVVGLIVLFSLLGGRRGPDRADADRVTTIDRTREYDRRTDDRSSDRRDDDIRRAG